MSAPDGTNQPELRGLTGDDLEVVAAAAARWQADPATHIAYLSLDAAAVASELAALEPDGLAGGIVAWHGSAPVGLLVAEWDTTPPRVWWHGPFVDPAVTDPGALWDDLYDRARALLPLEVVEEEVATDSRHATIRGFADRHGFAPGEASVVLVLDAAVTVAPTTAMGVRVRPLVAEDRADVAALHEHAFPGTHTTGERLASGTEHEVVLVAIGGDDGDGHDVPVGYVAAQRHEGDEGYIDFLGVADTHRRHGAGRALLTTAVASLRAAGCGEINLTVRESNAAARALYGSIGFDEERLIVGWRKDFTLD